MNCILEQTNKYISFDYVPGVGPVLSTVIHDRVFILQRGIWVELPPRFYTAAHQSNTGNRTEDGMEGRTEESDETEREEQERKKEVGEQREKEAMKSIKRKQKLEEAIRNVMENGAELMEGCTKGNTKKKDEKLHEANPEEHYFIARFRFH